MIFLLNHLLLLNGNNQMTYLVGMILGKGEVQRDTNSTTITIEISHKNLRDDEGLEV